MFSFSNCLALDRLQYLHIVLVGDPKLLIHFLSFSSVDFVHYRELMTGHARVSHLRFFRFLPFAFSWIVCAERDQVLEEAVEWQFFNRSFKNSISFVSLCKTKRLKKCAFGGRNVDQWMALQYPSSAYCSDSTVDRAARRLRYFLNAIMFVIFSFLHCENHNIAESITSQVPQSCCTPC